MGLFKGRRGAHQADGERTLRDKLDNPSGPLKKKKEWSPGFGVRARLFWQSGKGKILLGVLCGLVVVVAGVALALRMWIKPPEPPGSGDSGAAASDPKPGGDSGQEGPSGPTDDELYPDDGYGGDMPTVSGNRKEGIYTFLLVGTDLDDGNTDTIMVVSYDTVNQDINIMSIPRDTMINVRWDIKRVNSIYGASGRDIEALKRQVRTLIGFTPDFYVKVDLKMFVELVDLIEGVEFDVPRDMDYDDDYQDLHIHLKKGVQVLDGEHAMQLVRFRRYPEGDIKRVEVQQEFMKALVQECLSFKHWGKVKAYIDLAMENVETDLELGSVVWFAANVLGLNSAPALRVEDVNTYTLPGNYDAKAYSRAVGDYQSYVTIYPKQVVEMVNEHFNPFEQQVTTAMLDAMSVLSNGDIASSTGTLRDTTHNAVMAVQRGEAYYDEAGNIVYGTPPVRPEQDEAGRYYILDEDGNIVYTDEEGNPIEDEPDLPTDTGNSGQGRPNTGTGGSQQPEQGGDAGASGEDTASEPEEGDEPETELPGEEPEEPQQPEEPGQPEEPEDEGPPSWLFPDA